MFQALDGLAGNIEVRAPGRLREIDANFAGQIATSVWLGYLSEAAACEALLAYAVARRRIEGGHLIEQRDALLAEYRRCRKRQELMS